ncbi:MAG: YdbL family protein [Gammaproteobacteria bacterium]|nr:YdbL family protein [Gammaproteobacteria bacterium]
MILIRTTGLFFGLMLLAACVTINIYFPEAQAEEAAKEIVDDILGKQIPGKDKGASVRAVSAPLIAERLLDLLIPSAHAAQPDFNIDTPEIRKLRARMKQRHQSLKAYFNNGSVGFTANALISIRDASAVPLQGRSKLQRLVQDENKDRNALYRAMAEANGHPEWEPKVRATLARVWIDSADKGWWYQRSSGAWARR